jgi:hypothetical protein
MEFAMEKREIGGVGLHYALADEQAADLIAEAIRRSIDLITRTWGVPVPEDCRVYVMTSWMRFMFDAAPWHWRVLLAATLPIWFLRVRRTWPYAGGWAQRFGRRRAVGVKPPDLLQKADTRIGIRVFVHVEDPRVRVGHITCHELTHAFTAHLGLPAWLNEGLAMVTADHYAGADTVLRETLEALRSDGHAQRPRGYRRLSVRDPGSLIYLTTRGYWITRFLAETNPDLLPDLLKRRQGRALDRAIEHALGLGHGELWQRIDDMVVDHFTQAET